MNETYIKVKSQWCYLYRSIDKQGNTPDFLLTKRRQRLYLQRFLIKVIVSTVQPEVINIDNRGLNNTVLKLYKRRNYSNIKIWQYKLLNNVVEKD